MWEHPDAGGTMQFNISRVTEVTLAGQAPSELSPGNLCEVMLITGDHFRGNLPGTTEQHYLLDTWHAGKLQIARKTVRKIAPLPKGLKSIAKSRYYTKSQDPCIPGFQDAAILESWQDPGTQNRSR